MEVLYQCSMRDAALLERLIIAKVLTEDFPHFCNRSKGGECASGDCDTYFVYCVYYPLRVKLPPGLQGLDDVQS